MASFIIHHIAGEQFLKEMKKQHGFSLTTTKQYDFLLGNLIVDSSKLKFTNQPNFQELIQKEKVKTHFRSSEDKNLCIQVPQLNLFLEKYGQLLKNDPSALGYFYHLFTDLLFFEDFFTEAFKTLDQNGNITKYLDETKLIKIEKNGKIVSQEEFWSHSSDCSIYHDYTIMNQILLNYYKTSFDSEKLLKQAATFHSLGIMEVDYQNITSIIKKTAKYISESYQSNGNLNIFEEQKVIDFISLVAKKFIEKYYFLFETQFIKEENPKMKILN